MIEIFLVGGVILVAVIYLGYKAFRRVAGTARACGGCGECAATDNPR